MKNSKNKSILIYSIIGILLLGSIIYYTWPKQESESEHPPVLSLSNQNFQALLRVSNVFLELEEEDRHETCDNDYDIPKTGDNLAPFYWFTEDTSWGDFVSSIDGDPETYIIIAYYSPDEGYYYPEAGFYAYPGGTSTLEVENDEDDETDNVLLIPVVEDLDDSADIEKEIPAYRPFLISTSDDIELCEFKNKIKTIDDPADTFNPLSDYYEGWVMLQAPEDSSELATWLDDQEDRISENEDGDKLFWYYSYDPGEACPYDSDGDDTDDGYYEECFVLGDIDNPEYTSDNYSIWIKFDEGASVS